MCRLLGRMCRECAVYWEGFVENVQIVGKDVYRMCRLLGRIRRECADCWEGCVENVQFIGKDV